MRGRRRTRICRRCVKSLQPKLGALAKTAVEKVASIAGAILLFLASFIVAGIIMAFGRSGAASAETIFDRIMGTGRGDEFVTLSSATIRAVALGVLAWRSSRPSSSA